MALEVTVGPPVLTINDGHTFLVSELDGSITPASDQGLYSADTRYLSGYQLFIDGKSWTLLNSGAMAYYASQAHLVNPMVVTEEGVIAPGTVGLLLSRTLAEGLHEDLDIRNYTGKHLHFILEVLMRSDFADLFEVKAKQLTRRGHIESDWKSDRQELVTRYDHQDIAGVWSCGSNAPARRRCTPTDASALKSFCRRGVPGTPAANTTSWPTTRRGPLPRNAGRLTTGWNPPTAWRTGSG